ncbi:MAG: GGDEF domain-containing protein [Thermodesulfobacteriota bacterium]|nr:GGDEF domain-containing protein [Thermodesulfobacteriota bacterium]
MGLLSKNKNDSPLDRKELIKQLEEHEQKEAFLLLAARGLLYFIKDFSSDLGEIDDGSFGKEMQALTDVFVPEEKTKTLKSSFDKHKKTISRQIAKQKKYLQDREKELKDIIDLLTKAVASLNVDNLEFSRKLLKQSEELDKITMLDDIKKIKNSLKLQIDSFRETIKEKQSYDNRKIEVLSTQVTSLEAELEKAKEQSLKDGLTKVYNRQAYDSYLRDLVEENSVTHSPFSMLILDIDDFKEINDTFGHQIGDRVLLATVNKCKEIIRKQDFLARYGGDEFVIILPGASLRNALKKAKQICKAISSSRYTLNELQDGRTFSTTVSIGLATYTKGDTVTSASERADQALYVAKKLGKNRAATEKEI